MERVRDTLDWLATKRIFYTFDSKDGFYQVDLDPKSKECTAIRTVLGFLQYTGLPQGFKNAPGDFQRIINIILGDMKGRNVLTIMDGTSVGTPDEETHLQALAEVLDLLGTAGVRLKLSKCQFGVRLAEILRHVVYERGILPSDKCVEAIRALEEPNQGMNL